MIARFKLKDIGTIITGNTPKTSDNRNYDSNDICFVKPSDIDDNELSDLCSSECYISEYARGKARIVPAQSVLVTCIGIIGKVGVNSVDCAFNQQINAIIPNIEKCDCRYLAYAIQRERPKLQSIANAPVVPILNKSQFSDIEIPLPSLAEQRKIAAVLDKVSNLIAKRRQQLDKLDELVKSRFIEMFGDPKSNPNSYPISQLSEHIEFLTSGSRGWAQYCVDNGSEWFITIKNVKGCRISIDNMQPINAPDNAEAKRTKVQEGDLLISITADLGRTGVVTKEIADHGAYINQHLICIRLNKEMLNPLYVAFFMESPAGKEQFESKNQSAVKAGLNFNSINSLRLLVPPMDEQNAFVGFVHQIDKSKLTIQKTLDKLEILKKALMQEYFG